MIDLYSVGFNECPDTLNSKPTKIPTGPPYHCAVHSVLKLQIHSILPKIGGTWIFKIFMPNDT